MDQHPDPEPVEETDPPGNLSGRSHPQFCEHGQFRSLCPFCSPLA